MVLVAIVLIVLSGEDKDLCDFKHLKLDISKEDDGHVVKVAVYCASFSCSDGYYGDYF